MRLIACFPTFAALLLLLAIIVVVVIVSASEQVLEILPQLPAVQELIER